MTFEEKVKMYMKCSKKELAKMLAERDRLDQYQSPNVHPLYLKDSESTSVIHD